MKIEPVDAFPQSRVHNSQPHGIGRVVALDGLYAWNNLGRSVVFADGDFRPRALFDESVFTDDEPSQYDLDIHAILEIPSAGIVLTLNHLGMLRAYWASDLRRPGPLRHVRPLWTRTLAPDVERAVVLGDRIVASRPREQGAPGLLVTEHLSARDEPRPLLPGVQLEACGMVTALATLRDGAAEEVAIGANGQVSVAPATAEGVGAPRWTVAVDFDPMVLLWDGALVWAAGSERSGSVIDDYDWEMLHGGGFAALDATDGRRCRTRSLLGRHGLGQWRRRGRSGPRRAVRHRAPGPGVYVRYQRRHTARGEHGHCGLLSRNRTRRRAGRRDALRLQSRRVPTAGAAGGDVVSDPYNLRL